jgi:cell division initiation protein
MRDWRAGGLGSDRGSNGKGAFIVEITPQDVQQKQFDYVKRGFDPQQVGVFLDQLAATLAKRDRTIQEARSEIEALGSVDAEAAQDREAFRLTLNVATETMDEMLRMASERASKIEEEAKARAELLLERARVDAEDELTSLKRELESLERERARLESHIDEARAASEADQPGLDTGQEDQAPERRPLELVVDRGDDAAEGDASGLAARVGDLRG